ncbi:tetraacyldisaccharide 4'-kinase [Candidatus Sumerlaeota bacterium]|nr:tetraacyldisaccharide 4'-kinase [Candidatus Sumerlaeota bacterium]
MSNKSSRFSKVEGLVQRLADGHRPRGVGEVLLTATLRAASVGWWMGAATRSLAFDLGLKRVRRAGCPVIGIGNLSVGGTGKTPMVIETARLLAESGRRVAVVSRGYRRRSGGEVVVVSDGRSVLASRDEAGDEPSMIAQSLPGVAVVVGADRTAAARKAIEIADPAAILLDDGFQHRALARDCDIVLWDALRSADTSALLPRGLLREGLGALRRAHALVFTRCNLAPSRRHLLSRIKRIAPHLTVFHAEVEPTGLFDSREPENALPADSLHGRRVAAWCGLGNPASFWKTLEVLGAKIVCRQAFPDHYRPSAADLSALADKAVRRGAEWVVTTEKDLQNSDEGWDASIPLRVLRVKMTLGADTERYARFLAGFLPGS